MNLTIDIGNTRAKIALFDGENLVSEDKFEVGELPRRLRQAVVAYRPEQAAYCCVGSESSEMTEVLQDLPCPLLHVTGTTPSPVRVGYRTPETLGADRLAAVVGAVTLMPHTALLVIDAGTCITYDFVDAGANYLGGNISPGVEMRLEALHMRTAHLPHVGAEGTVPDLGYDTETAIRSGVVRGIGYELQGFIRHWQKRYPALRTFLTGGDRYVFSDALRKDILTDSHLLARGLNRLLLDAAETGCKTAGGRNAGTLVTPQVGGTRP